MEALSGDEKCQWMLLIHFAKSRISSVKQINSKSDPTDTPAAKEDERKSDFVIEATGFISEKSNKAIDAFFMNIENGKQAEQSEK